MPTLNTTFRDQCQCQCRSLVCDSVIIILAVTPACRHAPEKMSQIGCNAGMVTCTGTRPQSWDLKNAHFEIRQNFVLGQMCKFTSVLLRGQRQESIAKWIYLSDRPGKITPDHRAQIENWRAFSLPCLREICPTMPKILSPK